MADEDESGSSSDDELADDEEETPRLSVQDGDSEDESDYRSKHVEIGGLEGSAVGKSRREDDEATVLRQSPRSEGRGRSRSPKRGKKKGGKSPKSGKSRSKSKSKSKSRSKSKSKKGRSKSKSPKSKKGKSKSPKGSRSRSKSPKGKGKGKKGKGKKGSKKGKKRKSFQQLGRKEIQAALDRTVYEARIQELERQLARVKHQRDKVLKLTDEDSEVKDFMSKEMQVELEHQQTVIQDLMTKAAEERRSRRRQERLLQDQLTQQGGALKRAEAQVVSLQKQVCDSQAMWEDAQKALLDHDNLLKQIKALKDQLNDKDTTLKEYEGRLTILQRAAKMAGLIQKTKTGEMKAVGGATGLVPILLEGMKMFPLDRVLQREMCVLITHIAFTPEDYLIMSQYEGLELILKALENHRASRPLVASALRMLWKFSTASLELRDRLRSYGGLALMLNLLTVIPQQSVRRMEFFAGRTIAYLMPPRISKHCPPELLAEEIAKSRETHQRRVSEGNLPFLITPTISVMNNAPRRKSTSIDGVVGAPLQEGRVEAALPGAFGETSTLLLSTWDLVKILLTFLTWASSELVEFDPEAARHLRERREAEEKALNPIPPVSARSSTSSTAPASSHSSVSRAEGWSKAKQNMRRVSNNEVEAEAGLWRPNPVLARKMAGDALVALVAAIEARDDGSACRRLVFSQASLTIITRVWRVFFDSPDVVMAACVLIRTSLLVEEVQRAEQLTFLRTAGLDRLLKASQRRLAGDSKVMTEIITLSRIFFVEVVF